MTVNFQSVPNPLLTAPFTLDNVPQLTAEEYQARIRRLWDAAGNDFTHMVIYADREHYSNMEYLTGYDPRFEEALLILSRGGKTPAIIVGCEGMDYATKIPFPVERILFAPFGLVGQTATGNRIGKVLVAAGLAPGAKVGLAGWKYFMAKDSDAPEKQFEVPWYMVDAIFEIVGRDNVTNIGALFMHNETGLRHRLEAKELVLMEIAGTKSSRATHRVIANLREGMTEVEAAAFLGIDGTPLGTHPNVNFGWGNVAVGLASPGYDTTLRRGDPMGAGVGYRRSLCHRAGVYAESEKELSAERRGCVEKFYIPYFASVAAWYEAVGIGVAGGEVYKAVTEELGSLAAFGVGLNPGHLIHTEEWSNSPFEADSPDRLPNGVAIQCDFTAVNRGCRLTAHAEDGIILADAALRREIGKVSPASLERMLARRDFMRDKLGIRVRDEVLPTSDMPGWFTPFLAAPEVVMTRR